MLSAWLGFSTAPSLRVVLLPPRCWVQRRRTLLRSLYVRFPGEPQLGSLSR